MVDNRFVNWIFLTTSALVLNGCMGLGKGDFSCPSGVDGVRCMSARQVYLATELSDYVKTKDEDDESGGNRGAGVLASSKSPQTSQVAVPSIEQAVPIRTQARVMRIWMAPWEDNDGDLHADGYLYTEIESRRWNLGDRFRSPGTSLSPLVEQTKSPTK